MGRVYSTEGAYEREMVKWEARDGPMGQGLRPHVHREYPMMLHHATAPAAGGMVIDAQEIANSDDERARLEHRGFRPTPLEAIAVLEGTQFTHAELAAERNFEVLRMSPKARAEVARAEDAAGAVHLPTIPETPHGLRGVPVPISERAAAEALANAEETISQQQTELAELRAMLAAKLAEPMDESTPAPRKRGRPKKAAQAEA